MALVKIIHTNGGQVGIWRLTESSNDLLSGFSPEELENADFWKYNFEKRKVEWLAIRALLKVMIGPVFEISYSESGRPILAHYTYKHLSISHSREFVAVYVHENCAVGIDLESIDRNYEAVKKRFLSDSELKETGQNPVLQCLYWCAKEAIFKLVPFDGVEFREQIHVWPFKPEQELPFSVSFYSGEATLNYLLHFEIFENHCMVWVHD